VFLTSPVSEIFQFLRGRHNTAQSTVCNTGPLSVSIHPANDALGKMDPNPHFSPRDLFHSKSPLLYCEKLNDSSQRLVRDRPEKKSVISISVEKCYSLFKFELTLEDPVLYG